MDDCHVLLGKLWQFDVKAIYYGKDNIYLFFWKYKKILLNLVPELESMINTKGKKVLITVNGE